MSATDISAKNSSGALSRLVTMALVAIAVLAMLGLGTVMYTYRSSIDATQALMADAIADHQRALDLAVAEKDMELDITAIQELAEDAGDVGSDPAYVDDVKEDYAGVSEAAETFKAHAAKAREIGTALNDTALVQTVDSMSDAVPGLRDASLNMAHAYVEKGREAGNVLMKNFDSEADRLKDLAKTVRNGVSDVVKRAASEIQSADVERTHAESLSLAIGIAIGVLMLAACGGLVFLFRRKLLTPIRDLTGTMLRLARHDLSAAVDCVGRKDEIGEMAGAVQVFKDNMVEGDRLKAEQEEAQRKTAERATRLDELTKGFEAKVGNVVQSVASQATQMEASAQSMSATAELTTKQAGIVAAASEECSANVQTVASAAEELSSSIAEIARQVGHSSRIASGAVSEATKANDMVVGLANASQKIGEIVALINDIADQTNLLALNATIEAARAGEAGKGFAVVASEVKNLATQTSKATEDIRAQIGNVQSATQDAVKAIGTIGKTIGEIDQIAATIAAAVEEQGAATKEIARNVEETAKGTQEVSSNISGVTEAANGTGAAAVQVLSAARALSGQSSSLKDLVQKFLVEVKAA